MADHVGDRDVHDRQVKQGHEEPERDDYQHRPRVSAQSGHGSSQRAPPRGTSQLRPQAPTYGVSLCSGTDTARAWRSPDLVQNPVRYVPRRTSMLPAMELNGTAAIVSGGASGLGEATV